MPLSGTSHQPSCSVPPSVQPQVSPGVPLATTVRRFRQRRRQLSSESNLVSQTGSAATAPAAILSNSTTTTGSSAAGPPDAEGGRAYSDPTEMMEKRKRCNERAERMRKAYRRRLREEFGNCLSGAEATITDLGSPASRSKQGDENVCFHIDQTGIRRSKSAVPLLVVSGM